MRNHYPFIQSRGTDFLRLLPFELQFPHHCRKTPLGATALFAHTLPHPKELYDDPTLFQPSCTQDPIPPDECPTTRALSWPYAKAILRKSESRSLATGRQNIVAKIHIMGRHKFRPIESFSQIRPKLSKARSQSYMILLDSINLAIPENPFSFARCQGSIPSVRVCSSCQTFIPPAQGRWGCSWTRAILVAKPCFHRRKAGGELLRLRVRREIRVTSHLTSSHLISPHLISSRPASFLIHRICSFAPSS